MFVSNERVAQISDPVKFLDVAPDLAVEVLSPNDTWTEVEKKLPNISRQAFSSSGLSIPSKITSPYIDPMAKDLVFLKPITYQVKMFSQISRYQYLKSLTNQT
jgi:hypothetical protein